MVADTVEVITCRGNGAEAIRWASGGDGAYSLRPATAADAPPAQGTRVVLHLKKDAAQFAERGELRKVLKRYSSFIPFPVMLDGERVNAVDALWTRPPASVAEAEHAEFYRRVKSPLDLPRSPGDLAAVALSSHYKAAALIGHRLCRPIDSAGSYRRTRAARRPSRCTSEPTRLSRCRRCSTSLIACRHAPNNAPRFASVHPWSLLPNPPPDAAAQTRHKGCAVTADSRAIKSAVKSTSPLRRRS